MRFVNFKGAFFGSIFLLASTVFAVIPLALAVACGAPATQRGPEVVLEEPNKTCPLLSLGETAADCPWAGISRELQAKAESTSNLLPDLQALAPALTNQLRGLSKLDLAWPKLWGTSLNFDSGARHQIVDPSILSAISLASGIMILYSPQTWPGHSVVHAGVEHTYGYVFSTVQTPFGYKRLRWVSGEIERGFNLPVGLLGPLPIEGSLLANVTFFMGQIAFSDAPEKLAILKRGQSAVPVVLQKFSYSQLKSFRVVETVYAPDRTGKERRVSLRTDFAPFLNSATADHPDDHDTGVLVYSVDDANDDGPRLITAFPVDAKTASRLVDPKRFGTSVQISTQYNAYVAGLTESPRLGTRALQTKSVN